MTDEENDMGTIANMRDSGEQFRPTSDRPVRRVYRFGGYDLTTSPLRLDRNGQRVEVRPQSLRLLERLLSEIGSVVATDDLFPASQDARSQARVAVVHLRRVLGDRSGSPRFVETVRGQGYRFVHPVEVVEEPMVRWQVR